LCLRGWGKNPVRKNPERKKYKKSAFWVYDVIKIDDFKRNKTAPSPDTSRGIF
jgi:hypothetical protein